MVNNGASVPPDVPLPSAIDHEMNFIAQSHATICIGKLLRNDLLDVVVADAERPRREVADQADTPPRRWPATTSNGSADVRTASSIAIDRAA